MSDIKSLEQKATLIRRHIITSITKAKSGHPGGSLSCADLIAALYFDIMNIRPEEPGWEDRTGSYSPKVMRVRLCMRLWRKKDIFRWRSWII